MRTPEHWTDDPEAVADYERMNFESEHRALIEQALRDVDAARRRLVDAQNELCGTLGGTSDYARTKFIEFYKSGGVTAREWRAHAAGRRHITSPTAHRGQLRLVPKAQAT